MFQKNIAYADLMEIVTVTPHEYLLYLFLRSSNAHTLYDDIVSNYQGDVAENLASVIFPSTCTELAPSHAL